jgi:hypothetical protein
MKIPSDQTLFQKSFSLKKIKQTYCMVPANNMHIISYIWFLLKRVLEGAEFWKLFRSDLSRLTFCIFSAFRNFGICCPRLILKNHWGHLCPLAHAVWSQSNKIVYESELIERVKPCSRILIFVVLATTRHFPFQDPWTTVQYTWNNIFFKINK